MIVRVKLFALARQAAGASEVSLELGERATLGDVRAELARRYPQLGSLVPRMLLALGTEYAPDDARLAEGAEVACIPPVSGGSFGPRNP